MAALRPGKLQLARHLEGWPAALALVGGALLVVGLVVPRTAEPHILPVPIVDRVEQRDRNQRETRRADEARANRLPFEVRAVGERLRRCGWGLARGDGRAASEEARLLLEATQRARREYGDEPLLALRAVQTEMFLSALRHWEISGIEANDLRELGGDFVREARANGWIAQGRVVMSANERRVAYRLRWTRLTGLLETHPFSPALNEWRAYYRFLLEHPERSQMVPGEGGCERRLLSYVVALGDRDPSYPTLLAQGVLHYRLRDYDLAQDAFRLYLAQSPDGPMRTWARNYLVSALRRTGEATGPALY